MDTEDRKLWGALYQAAYKIITDFDTCNEVLQTDDDGKYGPTTAIERLRQALTAIDSH